jgi:hypothetical protein
MLSIQLTSIKMFLFYPLSIRRMIRILIGVSALVCFLGLYDIYIYMPWHRCLIKAAEMTFFGHAPIYLATLEIRSRWRFLVAIFAIPSLLLTYMFHWHFNVFTLVVAVTGATWLLFKVLWGRPLDD